MRVSSRLRNRRRRAAKRDDGSAAIFVQVVPAEGSSAEPLAIRGSLRVIDGSPVSLTLYDWSGSDPIKIPATKIAKVFGGPNIARHLLGKVYAEARAAMPPEPSSENTRNNPRRPARKNGAARRRRY